ncbi:hypothetical protein NDU88_006938 [Pleurodeles waltl]|uniref:Uncharacterized protein n=1 Tax=Pleurodeles waltl TaxID=8319 RepID=A0AAV7SR51_PLEWA|nr:hypothetical protein NDU88_006938 [Pleurodeles waltl]
MSGTRGAAAEPQPIWGGILGEAAASVWNEASGHTQAGVGAAGKAQARILPSRPGTWRGEEARDAKRQTLGAGRDRETGRLHPERLRQNKYKFGNRQASGLELLSWQSVTSHSAEKPLVISEVSDTDQAGPEQRTSEE